MTRETRFNQRFKQFVAEKNLTAFLLLIISSFLTLSCSTAPIKFQEHDEGSFSGKARIRDASTKKTYIVNMDLIARSPDRLRMEVTSTLGIHLASFALKKDRVTYYLPKQKKYFNGKASARSMRPIIGMNLEPQKIMEILFDREPEGKSWTCKRELETGLLSSCENERKSISLKWIKRRKDTRVIDIASKGSTIQLYLSDFQPKVQSDEKTFFIEKP